MKCNEFLPPTAKISGVPENTAARSRFAENRHLLRCPALNLPLWAELPALSGLVTPRATTSNYTKKTAQSSSISAGQKAEKWYIENREKTPGSGVEKAERRVGKINDQQEGNNTDQHDQTQK